MDNFEPLEVSPDAMVITDHGGRIVFANTATEALFGYKCAELLGESIECLMPERFRSSHKRHRHVYDGAPRHRPMGTAPVSFFGQRKDGCEFPVDIALRSFADDEGRRWTISAIRDTTTWKELERAQHALEAERREVQRRSEFLQIVSHELNTPMTSVVLQVGSMLRELRAGAAAISSERAIPRLESITRALGRIQRLMADLTEQSHISHGELALQRQRTNLADVVRRTLEELRPQFRQAQCHVHPSLADVEGDWDPFRLEQVVANLLGNALKFGGKTISVSVSRGENGRACLVVADHGVGIAPEDHERIFRRFERAASADHYGGLGLGLWIVREIAVAHGGTVTVESVPGEGARFVVELPCETTPAS